METPTVRVLSTGGTIASKRAGTDGASPSLSGEELVATVPALDEYANVEVEEITRTSSTDIGFETLFDLREAIATAAADDVDGVVVTHGTDTMEESAYFVDLLSAVEIPVAFTGAQRRPDEVAADGPANVLAAVRAASHDRLLAAGGTYVVFDEAVHAARDVTKTHTSKLGTFQSPEKGPVGALTREGIRFFREPGTRTPRLDASHPIPRVRMVKTAIDVGASGIEAALAADVDGIVLEAAGLGNTTAALGDAVKAAIEAGTPVVVTSRCHAGAVQPVYGRAGGGATLADHGAIFAGDLPAHKARIKLALALDSDPDLEAVGDVF